MIIIHLTDVARRGELALSRSAAAIPCGALALLSSISQGAQITPQPESPRLLPLSSSTIPRRALPHQPQAICPCRKRYLWKRAGTDP